MEIVYRVEDGMNREDILATTYQMRNFYRQLGDGFFTALDVMNYIQHHQIVRWCRRGDRVLALMARLPFPVFFGLGEAWQSVFAIVPAVTVGSIVAELLSELVDTEVYHWARTRTPQWLAVLFSNGVSLPLDSLIFGLLGFVLLPSLFGAEAVSFSVAMSIVAGQIIWKAGVTVISLPTIYLVKDRPITG